jgi:hypothetical protein
MYYFLEAYKSVTINHYLLVFLVLHFIVQKTRFPKLPSKLTSTQNGH